MAPFVAVTEAVGGALLLLGRDGDGGSVDGGVAVRIV
jgi:hypothetical protein